MTTVHDPPGRVMSAMTARLVVVAVVATAAVRVVLGAIEVITSEAMTSPVVQEVKCRAFGPKDATNEDPTCWPSTNCRRKILDGIFTQDEVERLVAIAEKGISLRPRNGGPTIVDINTGYIRDTAGLENMFVRNADLFSASDFLHYGDVIRRLKQAVMETFGLKKLFFTAPTFITRIDAGVEWKPRGIHDEYWHTHSDRNNTNHYQYSGLLYLSTHGLDFTGGRLLFFPDDVSVGDDMRPFSISTPDSFAEPDLIVEPRAGRVAMFSSGPENPHFVEPVESGERYVLSFWFSCDPSKEFEIFLDGKAHVAFSKKVRDSLVKRATGKTNGGESPKPKAEL